MIGEIETQYEGKEFSPVVRITSITQRAFQKETDLGTLSEGKVAIIKQ